MLFILFLNNTSWSQVFKLPALVTHYIEHHQLDQNVGVVEFLSMHYWGHDLDDDDEDKDNQLPFKKVDSHICLQVAIPVAKPAIEKQELPVIKTIQPVLQDGTPSNPALSSLFRPPRA